MISKDDVLMAINLDLESLQRFDCKGCGSLINKTICEHCSFVNKWVKTCGQCGSFRNPNYNYCVVCRHDFGEEIELSERQVPNESVNLQIKIDSLRKELEDEKLKNSLPIMELERMDERAEVIAGFNETARLKELRHSIKTQEQEARQIKADLKQDMQLLGEVLTSGEDFKINLIPDDEHFIINNYEDEENNKGRKYR